MTAEVEANGLKDLDFAVIKAQLSSSSTQLRVESLAGLEEKVSHNGTNFLGITGRMNIC